MAGLAKSVKDQFKLRFLAVVPSYGKLVILHITLLQRFISATLNNISGH